jgi:hypothetical protein
MRFVPKPSHFLPLPLPPSSHRIRVSHVDSPLGGGAPAYTTAARAVLGAIAPPEGAPTTVEDRSSHSIAASSPWTDSITKSE